MAGAVARIFEYQFFFDYVDLRNGLAKPFPWRHAEIRRTLLWADAPITRAMLQPTPADA